jgi:hypothetical protein
MPGEKKKMFSLPMHDACIILVHKSDLKIFKKHYRERRYFSDLTSLPTVPRGGLRHR